MSDNVYDDHPLMINSGKFWRCKHENTGLDNNANWIGCLACAEEKLKSLRAQLAEAEKKIEGMRDLLKRFYNVLKGTAEEDKKRADEKIEWAEAAFHGAKERNNG